MSINTTKKRKCLQNDLYAYIVIMLLAVVVSTLFLENNTTFFWAVNLSGLLIFFKYLKEIGRDTAIIMVLYILTVGVCPILTHMKYVDFTVKGIGTSLGILIAPLYICLFQNFRAFAPLSKKEIVRLLQFLSRIGTVLLVFSVALGSQNYVRVLSGSLGAYSANTSGIIGNKNVYGELLALSTCCDLFILKLSTTKSQNTKRLVLLIIKSLGVVLSFSRAALLQLAVCVFIYIWLERTRAVKEWLLLAVGIIVLIYGYINYPALQQVVLNQILRVDAGDAGRAVMRSNAWDKVSGQFISILFGVSYFGVEKLNIDIDNSYYYVLFTGGLVKYVFYIGWACMSMKWILHLRKSNRLLGNMCLSVTLSYYIYAMFESIPLLELGILNFIFMLFIFVIPSAYKK